MTIAAYLVLFGWIPAVLVMFAMLPARLAAVIGIIGAWLILPPYTMQIMGLPDYNKNTAATVGILIGALLFDSGRVLSFRPRWFDLPMVLWCLCGIGSSLQNGLGLYDGLSDALNQTVVWGLPYMVGRLYLSDLEGLRLFTIGMVVGGLCYVPLCLFEMRMMNSLLIMIYGLGQWGAIQGLRFGGYRPNVFFYTGLELGLWMTAASLAGWWLCRCGAFKTIAQVPYRGVLQPILLITAVLCRSTGALSLLLAGVLVLWLSVRFRTRLVLAALLLIGPVYVGVRTTNLWSGQEAVDLVGEMLSKDRAHSIAYRFMCEDLLMAKALQQPVFGWGRWGRNQVYFNPNTPWRKAVEMDGLWIITLGTRGFVGLILFYMSMVLPAILFVRRFPARVWDDPHLAAATLCSVFLGLYMIDCLLNGFPNVVYMTLAGGLVGIEAGQLRRRGSEARAVVRSHAVLSDPTIKSVHGSEAGAGLHRGQINLANRYRMLGRSLKNEGRADDAQSAWRQALGAVAPSLAAQPDSPELRRLWCDCANDLVWLQSNSFDPDHDRDLDGAVATARRMVELCPDEAIYWNTLGVTYYRAGDAVSAVVALDRAVLLGGGTAFDDVFLAMAHARLGDRDRARTDLARAIARGEQDHPGHPELAMFEDEARFILAQATEASLSTQA